MNIKEFIKESLQQICEGINEAKNLTNDGENSPIAPRMFYDTGREALDPVPIQFDISVIVEETSGKSGGGKLSIASLVKIDGEGKKEQRSQAINRIQFSVPYYPSYKRQE